ncbi:adenosine receptor A2b-like [Physella acuta]|uniref:adenosine receptor A2b-like n=1 Tax=Physella acuta TaxID=109671 RepID=UPI0027DB3CFB|nr:adenosine receptor A2b-like [Physella acuta]
MEFDEALFYPLEYIQGARGNKTEPHDSLIHGIQVTAVVCFSFFIPLTIFSNVLVFWGIVLYPGFKNSHNIFLLNLSVFDFIAGVLAIPLILMSKITVTHLYISDSKVLCLFKNGVVDLALGGSLYSLILISVDRYVAITRPLKYSNWISTERAYKIVMGLWIYNTSRVLIMSIFLNTYDYSINVAQRCQLIKIFKIDVINYVLTYPGQACLIVSAAINIHIAYIVYKQVKSFDVERSVWTKEQVRSFKNRIGAGKLTLVLTALFIILWVPFYTVTPLRANNMLNKRQDKFLRSLSGIMTVANSMVNAAIYAAVRKEYRDVYRLMLTTVPWLWKRELRKLHGVQNSVYADSSQKDERSCSKVILKEESKEVVAVKSDTEDGEFSGSPVDKT